MKKIRQTFPDIKIAQDIATVFGCPFEGDMSIEALLELIDKLRDIGIHAFTLCDTIGVAYPKLIQKVFKEVKKTISR